MSVVHALVPRRDLSAAIALGSATFNAARFIGPAIFGALIVWVSTGTVMAIAAAMIAQFYIVVRTIQVDGAAERGTVSGNLLVDIRAAVAYAAGHPGIRFLIILLATTAVLIRPGHELLPGYAAQVFDRGPSGLALLVSSIGLGGLGAGLWLAQRGETAGLARIVTWSLMASAIGLIAFTIAGHIWLAGFFLVIVGFFTLVGGIGSQTLIQNTVDSSMRARVLSLFTVISWGLPSFGALAMGWIASLVGLQATIAGGALVALAIWLWARRFAAGIAPSLEKMD